MDNILMMQCLNRTTQTYAERAQLINVNRCTSCSLRQGVAFDAFHDQVRSQTRVAARYKAGYVRPMQPREYLHFVFKGHQAR
jgi:hypothetical protein